MSYIKSFIFATLLTVALAGIIPLEENEVTTVSNYEEEQQQMTTEITIPTTTEGQKNKVNETNKIETVHHVMATDNTISIHGQTLHSEDSNSMSSHSLVRAFPVKTTPVLYSSDFVEQPVHLIASHGYVAPTNQLIYSPPKEIENFHYVPLKPQSIAQDGKILREQIYTVNLASPKYGYGYTVRGIQRSEQ